MSRFQGLKYEKAGWKFKIMNFLGTFWRLFGQSLFSFNDISVFIAQFIVDTQNLDFQYLHIPYSSYLKELVILAKFVLMNVCNICCWKTYKNSLYKKWKLDTRRKFVDKFFRKLDLNFWQILYIYQILYKIATFRKLWM